MNRHLKLGLKDFSQIPHELRKNASKNKPGDEIRVNLKSLFHHVFIDRMHEIPIGVNHEYIHYKNHVNSDRLLRFQRKFLGANKEIKIRERNKLGRGFCRWFLHEHCGINYFDDLENILGGEVSSKFGAFTIERSHSGDIPDFFCAKNTNEFFIAEAKGTSKSISFKNQRFKAWRKQFDRIEIKNKAGKNVSVKGYIVATRLLDESSFPNVNPTLLAEDPHTPGEITLSDSDIQNSATPIVANHYSKIFQILNLPLVSSSLKNNFQLDEDINFELPVWECLVPPLKGKKFIGGYFSERYLPFYKSFSDETFDFIYRANLSFKNIPFFGLEINIANQIRLASLRGIKQLNELTILDINEDIQSSSNDYLSVLRDGTVYSSLDYFKLKDVIKF